MGRGGNEMKRFKKFKDVDETLWEDWHWQMSNSLTHKDDIRNIFPALPETQVKMFKDYTDKYKLRLTPYLLSLIALDNQGNPLETDPVWRQFCYLESLDNEMDYQGEATEENWENPEEMPTRILQHKYPDRAIIRVTDVCFGHCNYCYLTSRVLDQTTSPEKAGTAKDWDASMNYIRQHPEIRDILLSGGDPLTYSNKRIAQMLEEIRSIPTVKTVRLNTRVFTFNPYRFDVELVTIFKKYQLTALEVHMCHSNELTDVVDQQLALMDEGGYRPLILWRAPLLGGVNDSEEVLEELFVNLYARRITPYYLFHYAPFTLGRSHQGVPLRDGSKMMKNLRRHVPGPAFPQYTLFHIEGKRDIPLDASGSHTFGYHKEDGKTVARFENWKGHEVTYPDVE